MFVTNKFVFLHQPKTGGTFVTAILTRLHEARGGRVETIHLDDGADAAVGSPGPGRAWKVMIGARHQHGRRADIPPALRQHIILATVRNPYDRYASQFEFAWWRRYAEMFGPVEEVKREYPNYPDLTFEQFVALTNRVSVPACPAWAPDPIGFHTYQFVESFAPEPEWTWAAMCEGSDARIADTAGVEFIDQTHLNAGLHAFLLRMGYAPADVAFILDADRIFPPEGGRTAEQAWPGYYSADVKAFVRRRERLLFERFPQFDV